jgi:riboflavin synthase
MFTGLVQAIGAIEAMRPGRASSVLTVRASLAGGRMRPGESVAVDGVCLTVEAASRSRFRVRAAAETLRRTTVGNLVPGARVNLERSLRPADRIGGHFVFGHVDGVAILKKVAPDGDAKLYTFAAPAPLMRYLAEKGSVALNGVSLTVFDCTTRAFTVSLIPHTLRHTTLGTLRCGTAVNLETDMLARYVERAVQAHARRPTRRRS